MITLTDSFRRRFPQSYVGFLILKGVTNASCHDCLDRIRVDLEENLRKKYGNMSRSELRNQPILDVYDAYFKSFGQNYPVLYQIESIASKGKNIPIVNCLVTAMFMAELKNMLLTAGHDLDKIDFPINVDIGNGDICYTLMNEKEKVACDNDMLMCDDTGVISSVIYGPDKRTSISTETKNVLFTVYAPKGIDKENTLVHLNDIKNNVLLFSPRSIVELLTIYP